MKCSPWVENSEVKVAQSCPTLEFSRPEYWSGLLFPSPGDLPNPGIKPGSPALQADSLPTELSGLQMALLSVSSYGLSSTKVGRERGKASCLASLL